MTYLLIGLIVFFGIHLLPSFVSTRQALVRRLGELPYKGLFALISLGGFILIVLGKAQAAVIPVWQPYNWGSLPAQWLMPLAFILVTAAYAPTNLRRITRHPMLWGVTLWAAVHLLANGDLASILLFASFALYSLFDMASVNRRGLRVPGIRVMPVYDVVVIIIGLAAYAGVALAHPYLFGAKVF